MTVTKADLDRLRDEAAHALTDTIGLAHLGASPQQVKLAAVFAVTAQAKYTLACAAADTTRAPWNPTETQRHWNDN